ncbi:MAG: diaminobutyrate--2-oxoglutarate transaminase [Alphaproteobacteria bacterium]|nr:diaminobutyrate--2-oxoglutarate transaminase [Alphaproteobacteria bacterium]
MYPIESNISSYWRAFPKEFSSARGNWIISSSGDKYLDFLSGCGSLNYGHNHPVLKKELVKYIKEDGITMSMDMATTSKRSFLEIFKSKILTPRNLDYKLQFTGPTGANAIEAAVKLARKITKRTNVIAFTNGFHGCSLGALALTGNTTNRSSSTSQLIHVTRAAYAGYFGDSVDTADQLAALLDDPTSGYDPAAAFILEVIQGEGGLNTASSDWLQKIAALAERHDTLLIIDEIQAGCGRSGTFFSFEGMDVTPDIIVMSKGISGFGLPMSLVLLRPDLDCWLPSEHNGTFRGNNHAFVTARAAIETFWKDDKFETTLSERIDYLTQHLQGLAERSGFCIKGRGMMQGVDLRTPELAKRVQKNCFERNLVIETCGPYGEVLKLLPPLTINQIDLELGLERIEDALTEALQFQSGCPKTI